MKKNELRTPTPRKTAIPLCFGGLNVCYPSLLWRPWQAVHL
jgi:hypothetical protein